MFDHGDFEPQISRPMSAPGARNTTNYKLKNQNTPGSPFVFLKDNFLRKSVFKKVNPPKQQYYNKWSVNVTTMSNYNGH